MIPDKIYYQMNYSQDNIAALFIFLGQQCSKIQLIPSRKKKLSAYIFLSFMRNILYK